ncbi:hypothetical protein [Rhodovulum sp. P5]|uniref:hypothetical protein n=1 Tax=Rhodovulum sp. P5 TaxID=1564506 RepID=UPI0012EB7F58|nr:hypothetical protein [Rhodovulum sp. P5]
MSEAAEPWHLMPVAILAVLWNLAGCADYVMTQYSVAPYLKLFTQSQAEYFTSVPALVDAAWAVGVWFGLAGAVLLFLRLGVAPLILGLSALSMLATATWLIVFATPPLGAVAGPFGVFMISTASAMAVLFYFFARTMRVSGALS